MGDELDALRKEWRLGESQVSDWAKEQQRLEAERIARERALSAARTTTGVLRLYAGADDNKFIGASVLEFECHGGTERFTAGEVWELLRCARTLLMGGKVDQFVPSHGAH